MAARKFREEYCGSCGKPTRQPWIIDDMRRRSAVEHARASIVGSARRLDLILGAKIRRLDVREELATLRKLLAEYDRVELDMWEKRGDRAEAREKRLARKARLKK